MPKSLRSSQILLFTSVAACIASTCVFALLLIQNNHSYTQASELNYSADQIIILVNNERRKNNLLPLSKQQDLMIAASNKTQNMIDHNYFSHISPYDGKKWSDFIQEAGYNYVEAGENLANGYTEASEMVQAWMDSPTHRANILAEGYKETGMAVNRGKLNGRETIFVTQTFGRK